MPSGERVDAAISQLSRHEVKGCGRLSDDVGQAEFEDYEVDRIAHGVSKGQLRVVGLDTDATAWSVGPREPVRDLNEHASIRSHMDGHLRCPEDPANSLKVRWVLVLRAQFKDTVRSPPSTGTPVLLWSRQLVPPLVTVPATPLSRANVPYRRVGQPSLRSSWSIGR
jgi:hypothetical protein